MNAQPAPQPPSQPEPRPADSGLFRLLAEMLRTRVELLSLDAEAHVQATLSALLLAATALLLTGLAIVFAGISLIVLFWDTHRVLASLAVTLLYAISAGLLVARARARWRTRPPVFAATLREIELDAEAVREAA